MTKYDDREVINTMVEAFKKGATIEIACGCAGIDESLYYKWQKKAESGDKKYCRVFQEFKSARSNGSLIWLQAIDEAVFRGVWQAAAWKLERIYPDNYGANTGMRDMNVKMDKLLAKEKQDNEEKANEQDAKEDA